MRFVNRIKQNKKIISVLTLFFVSFLFCPFANAGWEWWQAFGLDFLSSIVYGIVVLVGTLISAIIWLFLIVIEYNIFINAEPVIIGWEIIRDICNMGFVIVLLIIAIASILQIQTYHYRTWLPKLILMAILINFSKLICGILIDASQIITLTFASGIQQIGAGNFMDALGINHFLKMNFTEEIAAMDVQNINALNIMVTIFLALIVALIALVVVAAITLIFIIRIVALWILIILSPFAYLFSASPLGHQYASQWWQKFSQWVVTGPIMLFFIWLSLLTIKNVMDGMFSTMPEGGVPTVGLAEIGSPETMGAFILACVMLMASLVVAQQLGGFAARIAGAMYSKITSTGDKIVSGSWAGIKTGADWLNRGQAKVTGQDLNLKRRWVETIKPAMESRKDDDMRAIYKGAAELGKKRGFAGYVLGSGSKDWYEQRVRGFLGLKGMKDAVATTFKTAKESGEEKYKAEEEIEDLEKKKKGTISNSDYLKATAQLKTEQTSAQIDLGRHKDTDKDLSDKIKELTQAIEITNYTGQYQDYKEEKLKKMLSKEEEEKVKNDRKIQTDNSKLKNITKEKEYYEKIKEDGNLLSYDKAIEERKKIDSDIEKEKKIIKTAEKRQGKYILYDYEHQKSLRNEEYEEGGKLYSDDSDELILMFKNALTQGKEARASAILKRLAKNIDTNEILEAYGYNSRIGLTEEQYSKLKSEGKDQKIEQNKGLHDFMRDVMRDKLGMNEQSVFALESQMGGLAKLNNEAAFQDAVGVKNGEYAQNDSAKQQELAAVHIGKQDAESLARRGTRFAFGGEGIDGKFRVHESGLALMLNKYEIINKEIGRERLNPWNALKLTEETNMKILRDGARQLHGAQRDAYSKMLNNLEVYAEKLRGSGSELEDRIRHSADTISKGWG